MTYKTLKIISDLLEEAFKAQESICKGCDATLHGTDQGNYQEWLAAFNAKSRADGKQTELLEAMCDFNSHKWS